MFTSYHEDITNLILDWLVCEDEIHLDEMLPTDKILYKAKPKMPISKLNDKLIPLAGNGKLSYDEYLEATRLIAEIYYKTTYYKSFKFLVIRRVLKNNKYVHEFYCTKTLDQAKDSLKSHNT